MKSGNDIKIMHSDRTGKTPSDKNVSTKNNSKDENSNSESASKASDKETN